MTKIKIAHVISGLEVGGAETMLVNLLSEFDQSRVSSLVISLTDRGALADAVDPLTTPVHALAMRRRPSDAFAVYRLARLLRAARPDIIQTWMYVADLIGGIVGRVQGVPVIWSVHQSTIDKTGNTLATRIAAKTNALLSRIVPASILCVSEEAADNNRQIGFDAGRMVVIPNGIDIGTFRPDPAAGRSVRTELGFDVDDTIIGLVARHHPQKDHTNFFLAARQIARERAEARFVLCGENILPTNDELMQHVTGTELAGRVRLLGVRRDVPRLTAAFDIAVSSSRFGEAFSIALSEALACGVPCVATRVGNSGPLIEGAGTIVPPGDPRALADAVVALIDAGPSARRGLGEVGRQRIERDFSLPAVARRYEQLYQEIILRKRAT